MVPGKSAKPGASQADVADKYGIEETSRFASA